MQLDLDKIQPTQDYVIFKRDGTGGKTLGGIIIPETQYHNSFFGEVLSVGPGKLLSNGKRSPMSVKKGDRIIISQHDNDLIDPNYPNIQIAREAQILMVLEPLKED